MPSVAPVLSFSANEADDSCAIGNVLSGNREMFEVIVRRYNPHLYRIGIAYLRNHAHAEDAMQNAYLKAFLNLRNFRRGAKFSTWLTRIMINECLMELRRRKKASERIVDLYANAENVAAAQATDETSLKEMKAVLERAIIGLPKKYRTIYVLREIQQLTVAETATCLGLTPESVKVGLHRARERIKEGLLKNAVGMELFAYPAVFCNGMVDRVRQAIAAAN